MKCSGCVYDEIPEKNRPKPTSKKEVVYKTCTIGEFFTKVLPAELRTLSNHRFQKNELSKIGMVEQRFEQGLETPGNVVIRRDYTSRFPMEYNNLTMSVGLSGFPTVGMEGLCAWYRYPDQERVLDWMGCLSDEKQQDARTSYNNSLTVIPHLQTKGLLTPNTEQTCLEISDGCVKQYKGANAVQALIWRSWSSEVPHNAMITAAQHGKNLVDALAGVDKAHGAKKLIKGTDSATMRDGVRISQGKVLYDCLSEKSRQFGTVWDSKHKKPEGKDKVRERKYWLMNFDGKNPIPFENAGFEIPKKQWGDGKRNGIHEMFQFYTHPDCPGNQAAIRRMPCYCKACAHQMQQPWDIHKPPEEQEKFKLREDCIYSKVMGDYHGWKFVGPELIQTKSNLAKKEVNAVIQAIIDKHVDRVRKVVKIDGFGAMSCSSKKKDDFWLVQWQAKPYQLKRATQVEGSGKTEMKKGTWVCKGIFYDNVSYGPGWFERQHPQDHRLFALQHCLVGNVTMENYNEDQQRVPPRAALIVRQQMARSWVKLVPKESKDLIKRMEVRMSRMALHCMNGEVDEEVAPKKKVEEVYTHGFIDLDEIEPDGEVEDLGIQTAVL